MRILMTEEQERLNDIIEPYVDHAGVGFKLKPDAPEDVKQALKRLREIVREQREKEIELMF